MHILLVDDDAKLLRSLQAGLEEHGHRCETSSDPREALEGMLEEGALLPDIVLLDVMMPEMTGWMVLERMRAAGIRTPVVFLTARQEVDERVRGLELGADDYIIKPFAFRELLARVEAVQRRHAYSAPFERGELVIHRMQRRVEFEGRRIDVSDNEHVFLQVLAEAPEQVHTREELLERVWQIRHDPGTNLVDVLVARLRRKLGARGGRVIETVIREGYRLGPCASPHSEKETG